VFKPDDVSWLKALPCLRRVIFQQQREGFIKPAKVRSADKLNCCKGPLLRSDFMNTLIYPFEGSGFNFIQDKGDEHGKDEKNRRICSWMNIQ